MTVDTNELLKRLIKKQQTTNRLLAMAELRARHAKHEADREKIAKREGVDPLQVMLDDATYTVFGR